MDGRCTWHPVLRWLLFLPAGIVAMSLAEFFVRIGQWLNGDSLYWGKCLASAVEPWAFLAASLWLLPRFHRGFTLICSLPYICFKCFVLYMAFFDNGFTARGWWAAFLPFIAAASGALAARHYYRESAQFAPLPNPSSDA